MDTATQKSRSVEADGEVRGKRRGEAHHRKQRKEIFVCLGKGEFRLGRHGRLIVRDRVLW